MAVKPYYSDRLLVVILEIRGDGEGLHWSDRDRGVAAESAARLTLVLSVNRRLLHHTKRQLERGVSQLDHLGCQVIPPQIGISRLLRLLRRRFRQLPRTARPWFPSST